MTKSDDLPLMPRSILRELFAGSSAGTTPEALEQAARRARSRGFVVLQLGVQEATDARELARLHAAIALQCVRHGHAAAPTAILSGGPLVLQDGQAEHPHAQFLLALAMALDAHRAIYACACGPAARSGALAGAAAFIGPDTLARAYEMRINLAQRFASNEGRSVFEQLADYKDLPAAPPDKSVLRAILITQE